MFFQLEPRCLFSYTKNSSSEAVQMATKAVNEAVSGFTQQNTPDQQAQWKIKICAALVAKICERNSSDVCDNWSVDDDRFYFEAVTYGLPAFTQAFFFELVKACDMAKEFVQVKDEMMSLRGWSIRW